MRHRNSQKRYYIEGAVYFVTFVVKGRLPWFYDPDLAALFIEDLHICRILKRFRLFACAINPDHVHLLIRPGDDANYSEILRSLKTNFSRNASRVLARRGDPAIPKFRWQKSFHDHIIRDELDFRNHVEYIMEQPVMHGTGDSTVVMVFP
jgi:putative transposase